MAVKRALARIDAGAIERNCRLLRATAPHSALCAVVKADGYGHGAVTAARAARAGGAEWLAVATATEATELRAAGIDGRLLVMGALTRDELARARQARADVVAWTNAFADAAAGMRVHVKYDSGMGRLGAKDPQAALALCDRVAEQSDLAGLMTHLATADELEDDYFGTQLDRFDDVARAVRARHPSVVRHAANSAATMRDSRSHYDMVRCGVAIYGLDPFQHDAPERGLVPALSLESYVAAVRRFQAGESAGYGRTWSAERETWVATVPIGYGDGVRRSLSNAADVVIGGSRYPVVGTISMDNLTVDLGPRTDVEPGQPALLIGGGITVEELAERLGTINYEVTCGISARVERAGP